MLDVDYQTTERAAGEVPVNRSGYLYIRRLGAAGGGKTYAILMEPLRYLTVKGYKAVIFRKNYTQVTAAGGLWDTSNELYGDIDGFEGRVHPKYQWQFKNGASIAFDYIARDSDVHRWQGSQITMIGFDELTHFTSKQFFYMMSRNRSTCGVKPYIRATCNPDADSWVADFIKWWIDQDTGYPIQERSGVLRYMCRDHGVIVWGNSRNELVDKGYERNSIKSVTFIASTLQDNKILLEKDPGYLSNLKAMTEVDTERLLYGNWKIRPEAGKYFKRSQLGEIIKEAPTDLTAVCRGWDLAATDKEEKNSGEAAFTAGVLMGKRSNGRFVILDVINQQLSAGEVRKLIKLTAQMDQKKYPWVRQRLPQDPGQAGKEQAESYIEMLAGYDVSVKLESGQKTTRAEPMAAQWQHGMFDIVEAEWNEMYLNQLESFPDGRLKDMVDAGSSAFNEITLNMEFNLDNLL